LQPYRFIVVTDAALREQLKLSAYGQSQITDCSHLVVFAARTDVTADDVAHYMERIGEVRGVDRSKLEGFEKVILGDVVNGPRHEIAAAWCARQAYIALGNLMAVAALTAVDVCPMEGFSPAAFDEILGLKEKGLASVVLAAVGHRAHDDGAASLPKVRMTAAELIEHR
jgi:nitroreductase/dihydropteridine reductase